jgi:hypothetical protein
MRKKATLITGVVGEVGQALVKNLAEVSQDVLLTIDIRPAPEEISHLSSHFQGDILDQSLLNRLVSQYEITTIYHLAALLSTRGEFTPVEAHQVNVEGTLGLLQLAAEQSEWRDEPVKLIFPSSIAAYGMPDLKTKAGFPRVREWEWNYPITMYGCNKLYCELLGTYFSQYYRQLAAEQPVMLDFRCVRFPGLISAFTVPSGGTSDQAGPGAQEKSEALHLQRDQLQPHRRPDPRPGGGSLPQGQDHLQSRLEAQPHRRLLALRPERRRRPARLGLAAGLRHPALLPRISDPQHPQALPGLSGRE